MKPLRLEMSAFGSYAGLTKVDFTAVNHGIFLIAGDTGAGKTTIYDAINYALYDKTSGNQRDGNMMRSQYAALDVPTFVKLTFDYGSNEYTIIRNPEYIRESKRKKADGSNDSTAQKSEVSLILPDGSEFIGKKADINKKIVDIIGLDANQFSQVVMIAQGDFLKLLHANSDDRKIIFSKIFNTKIYWKIEEDLKYRFKKIYGRLEDNNKECKIIIDHVTVSEDSLFADPFQECKQTIEPDFEKLLPLIKNIINELKGSQKIIKKRELDLQNYLDEINAQVKAANDTNQLFVQLENSKRKSLKLEEQKTFINNKILLVDSAKKAEKVSVFEERYLNGKKTYEAAATRIAELNRWITTNQSIVDEKRLVVELLKNQRTEEEPKLQQIIARIDAVIIEDKLSLKNRSNTVNILDAKGIKTLQELSEEYKDCKLDFAKMETDVTELTAKKDALSSLSKNITVIEKRDNMQKADFQKLEIAIGSYRSKSEEYEKFYDTFLSEQAGILAKDLNEGEPCPVCGSITHPNKTPLSDAAVTQEQVDRAKKERDFQENLRDKANQAFLNSKGEYDKELDYIEREAKKIIAIDFVADDKGFQLILQKLDEFDKQLGLSLNQLETAKKRAEKYRIDAYQRLRYLNIRFEEESYKYQKLVSELEAKNGARDNEKTNYTKLENEYTLSKDQYKKSIVNNGFQDENDYKFSKKTEKELEYVLKEIEVFKEENIRTSENILLLTQQTAGKTIIEVASLLEQQKNTIKEKSDVEESHRIIYSSVQQNLDAFNKLENLASKRENLKREYENISVLSKTANGNLAGSAKIDFETYVLRQYFRQIIAAANKRLLKMVSNQFKLQCRNIDELGGQGSAGLDLDIFSMVTNSSRDVKTLSGGESFMAALSMALGLADVIQNSAGAVHIETMFIDEGFGSLDDESREQAIMILNELAGNNRLVGIISHVTELKEQIDCKLIVEKSEKGSRVRWSF